MTPVSDPICRQAHLLKSRHTPAASHWLLVDVYVQDGGYGVQQQQQQKKKKPKKSTNKAGATGAASKGKAGKTAKDAGGSDDAAGAAVDVDLDDELDDLLDQTLPVPKKQEKRVSIQACHLR